VILTRPIGASGVPGILPVHRDDEGDFVHDRPGSIATLPDSV
jgi:hypothetical protein